MPARRRKPPPGQSRGFKAPAPSAGQMPVDVLERRPDALLHGRGLTAP